MFSIDKTEFGSFVSQLRKEKGITQKELAQKLYISDKAVSKWETGQSIPDVALLVPLAEILGVTVTELLECHRIENPQSMPAEDVETIVKKAVSYQETEKRKINTKWLVSYCICALSAVGQLIYIRHIFAANSALYTSMQTVIVLSALFGGYFCLLAKDKLPAYYDENKISFYSDGPLRMNLFDLHFNNSNWPHIVRYIRFWSLLSMTLYALTVTLFICIFVYFENEIGIFLPEPVIAGITTMSIPVFSLVIPVYVIGKKYE